jgi:hypothetical protein
MKKLPRWRVIADFPGRPVAVGSEIKMFNEWQFVVNPLLVIMPECYPHLFEKIEDDAGLAKEITN